MRKTVKGFSIQYHFRLSWVQFNKKSKLVTLRKTWAKHISTPTLTLTNVMIPFGIRDKTLPLVIM
jgi:hypothetical protein